MTDNKEHEELDTVEEPAETAPEVEVEEESKSKKSAPAKKATPAKPKTIIPAGVTVELSKFVFESLYERNSRSVGLAQIRLIELGYMEAGSDKRGWLSTGTKEALEAFASDRGIVSNFDSEEVISAVFEDTPVTIVP